VLMVFLLRQLSATVIESSPLD